MMSTVDMGASYQQSGQQQATEQKLSSIMDSLRAREKTAGVSVSQPVSYATNFFWQVSHVCRVAMVQSWSNRSTASVPSGSSCHWQLKLDAHCLRKFVPIQPTHDGF